MSRSAGIVLCAFVALLGCSTKRPAPGWDVSPGENQAVHRASGLSFPARLPDLERGTMHAFDQSGSNASVAYSGTAFPLEITVFVYPRTVVPGGTAADHFRAALSDIYRYHPQARLERSGPMALPLSTDRVAGLSAFLTFVDGGRDLGSWLLVLPAGDFIVKVRATYERTNEGPTRLRQSFASVESVLHAVQRMEPIGAAATAGAPIGQREEPVGRPHE